MSLKCYVSVLISTDIKLQEEREISLKDVIILKRTTVDEAVEHIVLLINFKNVLFLSLAD